METLPPKEMMTWIEKQSKLLENMKQARKRYYEKNKQKINAQQVLYKKERYAKDPEFREKALQRSKSNYLKKIQLKQEENLQIQEI